MIFKYIDINIYDSSKLTKNIFVTLFLQNHQPTQ